ncbi:MAG TPA: peptidylprolyl isomerase [Caulobacteraceae bacterium]
MRWLGKIAGAGGAVLGLMIAASPIGVQEAVSQDAPTAAPQQPQGLTEAVVASVNDDIISTYDVVQRMRLLIVTSGIQVTNDNLPELQSEALRSLIDERLELQELRREGKEQKFDLIASDDEVNDEINDIARSNNTSADALLGQLSAQGVQPDTFKAQLRAEISWRGWIRGRYGSRVKIGEDQIKAYQARIQAESGRPQYQLSEIVIDNARAGGSPQAMAGASQLIDQLQKGAPFAAVARQFSTAPTAANGGDVGWVSPGEMPREVDQTLDQMRAGQLSAPIATKDSVYVVLLRDKRAGGAATLVSLKQAAVALAATATEDQVAAAQAKLEALRGRVNGCDTLQVQAGKIDGVIYGDLGEAEIKDLAPAFREAAQALNIGQVSEPLRTDAGLHIIAICNKRQSGADLMNHDEIENRLQGMQLSMISKRYLRDLRNSATIETR